MQPNFLVIGSAKCATTSLCGLLGAHPDVFMCQPKEPHFFSVDEVYHQGWQWYESLFANAEGKTAIGEGSTSYTKHVHYPDAPSRIFENLPDARLIFIARNPFEKAESLWMHAKANNLPTSISFPKAVRTRQGYVDECRYWHQINYYRECYPDDRILVLFYEEFKDDPNMVLNQCYRFLGVNTDFIAPHAAQPSNISHEDKILISLLRKIPFFDKVYFSLPTRIRYRLNAKLKRPATSRPTWDDETRDWFLQEIAQDMTQFLEFNGKPTDYWVKNQRHTVRANLPISQIEAPGCGNTR